MKKKIIIISICIISLLAIAFIVWYAKDDSSKILQCNIVDKDGAKTAQITYTYQITENNTLEIESTTELSFLNKEEADKYEKIVNRAFFKDDIIRKNNTIIIKSDKEDDENKLTLDEIKQQQEENGLVCNYK